MVDSRGHHLLEHGHVFLVGLLVDVGEVLGEAAVGPALFGAQLTLVLALVGPTNRRMGLGHPAMDPQLWSLTQCYSVSKIIHLPVGQIKDNPFPSSRSKTFKGLFELISL